MLLKCWEVLTTWPTGWAARRTLSRWRRSVHIGNPGSVRLALEEVRHVSDNRVLAEEERALDEQGRLVVEHVLPPPAREEFGQDDRDHLLVAAGLDLVDVVEERPQERPVRRRQDDQGHAEPPPGPLLLELACARGVR